MTKTVEEIKQDLASMEQESKALRHELFRIVWSMRGGISIDQAYMLCIEDREIISKILEENIQLTKESQIPFI